MKKSGIRSIHLRERERERERERACELSGRTWLRERVRVGDSGRAFGGVLVFNWLGFSFLSQGVCLAPTFHGHLESIQIDPSFCRGGGGCCHCCSTQHASGREEKTPPGEFWMMGIVSRLSGWSLLVRSLERSIQWMQVKKAV